MKIQQNIIDLSVFKFREILEAYFPETVGFDRNLFSSIKHLWHFFGIFTFAVLFICFNLVFANN